jgi:hypothetical protein
LAKQLKQLSARTNGHGPSATTNSTRRSLLGWTAGGGATIIGALLTKGLLDSETAQAQTPPSIVGSWVVTFPQGSGPSSDPNDHQIVSLTADGIMFSSNSPSSPPDPQQGPDATRSYSTAGQGAWVAAGAGKARFKFMSADTDEQGKFTDLVQISGTLTLGQDGNSFTGNFQVLVTGADGGVLFDSQGDAGTVQGTRITV